MKKLIAALLLAAGCSVNGRSVNEMESINLPQPWVKGNVSVEESILGRRSVRSFGPADLTTEEISQLLWAAQGITDSTRGFRAAPSAGATHPLEIYLVNREGVYNYLPDENLLKPVKTGDARSSLARAALGQGFVQQAPVNIVISAVYQRTAGRYGIERGARYVHIEAGHAAQNIHLQAVALGLGSVPVGAFRDDEVKKALSLPSHHEPLYIIPVGHPSRGD